MKNQKTKANKRKAPTAVCSSDLLGRCVTHHHSCDCREAAIRALLEEVIWWHSDPTLAEYNGCDTDQCQWCECAKGLLAGTMNHDEIVAIIGRPNAMELSDRLGGDRRGLGEAATAAEPVRSSDGFGELEAARRNEAEREEGGL